MKNCKYNIEWQYNRVALKNIKDIEEKLICAKNIFHEYLERNSDSVFSIINWLQGLSIAYKEGSKNRALVESLLEDCKELAKGRIFYEELLSSEYDIERFRIENNVSLKELNAVVSDNLNRAILWAKKFYIHKELQQFLHNMSIAINFSEANTRKYLYYKSLVKSSENKRSEWRFLY